LDFVVESSSYTHFCKIVPLSNLDKETSLQQTYDRIQNRLDAFRKIHNRPLSLAEKIVFGHLSDECDVPRDIVRGQTYLELKPDRVAMQDASGLGALLQFMSSGLPKTRYGL
jgi:aconitase A